MSRGIRSRRAALAPVLVVLVALASAACSQVGQLGGGANGGQVSETGAGRETARATAGPVVYVALGDSTGVGVGAERGGGYVARLFERIERARPGSSLQNFCVSGAETSDLLRGQLPRVARARPTLVTVGIGINDLTHGVSVEQFAKNYDEIVSRLKAETGATIVLTNVPEISTAPRVPAFMRDEITRRIGLFNERVREIADRHGVALVDAYASSRELIPKHPEFFSPDGFHPSAEGYEYWAKMMWPAVREAIGE